MSSITAPFVVWHCSDDKPGHDNQIRGLLRALAKRVPLQVHTLHMPEPNAQRCLATLTNLLRRRCPDGRHLPDPDLIVGAGHATHLPMLSARRARGGRVIVFMKPSLPLRCFDLCIVPQHDAVAARANVLQTRGPLNAIEPAPNKLEHHGLILLGGPSKHYRWSDQAMLENIATLVHCDLKWSWTVAGSRRTPDSMEQMLLAAKLPNLVYVAARDTGPEWLPFRLSEAPQVWVTEDSMSMVYEALSANAAVGVLPVPRRGFSRVSRDMEQLLAEGRLTSYDDWCKGQALRQPAQPLNEAARCAEWVVGHWLRSA
jgi:mitochondrial fission protein ELM1